MGDGWLASSRSRRFVRQYRMRWTMRESSDRETACDLHALSGKVNRQRANMTQRPRGKDRSMSNEQLWLAVGFLGQICFSMRFLVQWIASERKRESVIPVAFWFFSIAGGLTLLTYAIHRLDPVFIIGQAAGLFVYGRNLYLIRRKGQRLAEAHS